MKQEKVKRYFVEDIIKNYTLSWHHLSVYVKKPVGEPSFWKKTKYETVQILNDVSGIVNSGKLVAIMGPSGAGKTTLLATIACRLKDMVYGEICFNGYHVKRDLMINCTGFLPQIDITMDSLTVSEHLAVMANLKMDRRSSKMDHLRQISTIVEELGIKNCSATYLKNLSGGERKRVALAVQLLTDPLILFCDEPTTGLDSYNAYMVVKTLKKLAMRGKIVLCTIHQPASQIFDLFHEVILMAAGGRVAYHGPVVEVLDYFGRLNIICSLNYNIAEFIVKQVSANNLDYQKQVSMLCDTYESSDVCKYIEQRIAFIKRQSNLTIKEKDASLLHRYVTIQKPNLWIQFLCLCWRYNLDSWRNNWDHILTTVGSIGIVLTLVLFFREIRVSNQSSIQNIQGFMFLLVIEIFYQYSYHVVFTFQNEMPIVLREVNDGLYKAAPYYACQVFSKMIYTILEPTIYAGIAYYFTNVFHHVSIIEFCASFCAITFLSIAYGMTLSAMFDDFNTLLMFGSFYEMISNIQSGMNIKLTTMTGIFHYLRYISIMYYAFDTVTLVEWTSVKSISCEDVQENNNNCLSTGQEVLKFYGYEGNVFSNIFIMITFGTLLHILAFSIIYIRTKKQAIY